MGYDNPQKKYTISNDGFIFEIKEDGSINRLARIDHEGHITTLSRQQVTTKSDNTGGYWLFITLLAFAAFILGGLYIHSEDNYSRVAREVEYRQNEINTLRQERDKAQTELSNLQHTINGTFPLIITDIQIGNVNCDGDIETNYGETIYSYNTMYLTPKITYVGIKSGSETLKVKWYNSNGSLRRGTSSPNGFTFSNEEYIYEGSHTLTLMGWGNPNRGVYWSRGTYRIEIWYRNTCLKAKTFTIY